MPVLPELICVLDDDSSVLQSIEQLLDSDGLQAVSFDRADDLLAYVGKHVVLLAVLDVWMPEAGGLEVQAQLNEVSPRTKVIVMTGRETPAMRTAAIEGGAFAFVIKPFDDEEFLSLIRKALVSAM
ncbi:MAG: response regulator [Verrucomicrobia bacterium]|nr:response regulator [Verrucomicrobiota bacterium]